jgi:hypothetical protein
MLIYGVVQSELKPALTAQRGTRVKLALQMDWSFGKMCLPICDGEQPESVVS